MGRHEFVCPVELLKILVNNRFLRRNVVRATQARRSIQNQTRAPPSVARVKRAKVQGIVAGRATEVLNCGEREAIRETCTVAFVKFQ